MKSKIKSPKLSVRLMTFNHAPYIAQAIEGCLMQETDFDFDIVIGDDFSTDGTCEICKGYEEKYPHKIILLKRELGGDYHSKRILNGRLYNFVDILNNCMGEYIALLDGDDYWTDPKKLQLQVNFLESNQDFSICHHRVARLLSNGNVEKWDYTNHDVSNIYDLAEGNHISTPSCVYRNSNENLPDIFLKSSIGDYILHFNIVKYGKIKFLDKTMAIYRENVGLWSGPSNNQKNLKMLETINLLKDHYINDQKLLYKLNKQAALIKLKLAQTCLDRNDEVTALKLKDEALKLDKNIITIYYLAQSINDYFVRKELKYLNLNRVRRKLKQIFFK